MPWRGPAAFVRIPLLTASPESPFAWCLEDVQVQQRYGGLVAAVADHKIWGAGADRAEALQHSRREPGCPAAEELTCVLIPYMLDEDPV